MHAAKFRLDDGSANTAYTGRLMLCYKFSHAGLQAAPTPFVLFPNIRMAVIRYDSVLPRGTGVGCSSNLTVSGAGFSALVDGDSTTLMLRCSFMGLGSTNATLVNDSMLRCASAAPTAVGTYPMRVDVDSLTRHLPDTFPSFAAFEPAESTVTAGSLMPAGGPYNLEWDISLTGLFEDWGAPRCRFGSWVGTSGTVLNATHAICRKPRFPDIVRGVMGEYAVTFSPNGQCFPTNINASNSAHFRTYNSQVDSLKVSGAPSTSTISLEIQGEGFVYPGFAGGICRFSHSSRSETTSVLPVTTALETVSTTLIRCPTPASGVAGLWSVQVLQNGLSVEPSLFGDPLFETYDVTSVRVDAMVPQAIVLGVETTVTISGSGFANYGDGQLVCRVSSSANVAGVLVDSSCILCTFPGRTASTRRALSTLSAVQVSLNGGAAGSFSKALGVSTFTPPYLMSVSPTSGDAKGGTCVTLSGMGFTAFAPADHALRSRFMRCKFGDVVQNEPPLSHSDTEVVCSTTWGKHGAQPVSLTLNGVTFATRATSTSTNALLANVSALPHFTFLGSHRPSLIDVRFDEESTRLILKFDSQPTNRGGMNGVSPCRTVLDDATTAQLQGTSGTDAMCDWLDDSTLFAFLSASTAAAAGMTVTIRPKVLWPKDYLGSCNDGDSKCADVQSLTVSSLFPCDSVVTPVREVCTQPTAVIQAPNEIASCPGTTLTLDASRSTGGGVRPLTYTWSAIPTSCDNYYSISSALSAAGDAPTMVLSATEVDGGNTFTLILKVTTFLGSTSVPVYVTITRAAMPVPSVTIKAPPLLVIPGTSTVTIQAQAVASGCAGAPTDDLGVADLVWSPLGFAWSHAASAGNATAAPLILDAKSRSSRNLVVAGSSLRGAVVYTLRVEACMLTDPGVCGAYQTDIMLLVEPLFATIAGGDRTVGESEGFMIDACASRDPEDSSASCVMGICSTSIEFFWACKPLSANSSITSATALESVSSGSVCGTSIPPSSSTCAWFVAGNSIAPGHYAFGARVATPNGKSTLTSVMITIEQGALPIVTIGSLTESKVSPSSKLTLIGQVERPAGAAPGGIMELAWSIAPHDIDLALDNVTSTGSSGLRLVLQRDQLRPGGLYTFELRATYRGKTAMATSKVLVNRAPYGGALELSHEVPLIALTTTIGLRATYWVDDVDDLPLRYTFAYHNAAGGAEISLGMMSIADSTSWLPIEGNWTLVCHVSDVHLATTTIERHIHVGGVVLTTSESKGILSMIADAQAEGDVGWSTSLSQSFASTLNQVGGEQVGPSADVETEELVGLRGMIMHLVAQTAESATQDAQLVWQMASTTASIVQGNCASSTLDQAASVLATAVAGANEVGLAEGAAEVIVSAIGSILAQGPGQEEGATVAANLSSAPPPPSGAPSAGWRQRVDSVFNATDGLSVALGNSLVIGEKQVSMLHCESLSPRRNDADLASAGSRDASQVQIQSPGLTMGVSKEDPCDVASSTSQARREVPPLSNGASSSFYLSPGSMCEQGNDDYEPQSRRHLTHADPVPQSIEVSISLFENNMYAPASKNQIGTPVTSVKLRSSGTELLVRNFSDVMEVRVGVAPGVVPARGLPVAWECSPPPGYPPYPPSLPQPPASPPALPHPPRCFNIPLPPAWGALSCSNFGDLGPNSFYCTYADVQASCCGCGAGGSSMAPPPPSPFTPPPVNDSTCRPVYGAGDCSDLSYCSGRGTCVDGVCTCSPGFVGANCTVRLSCNYWNGETWSADGITSTLEEGTLVCATTCTACRPEPCPPP